MPVVPETPAAPGVPSAPAGPAEPVAPIAPVAPVGPAGPMTVISKAAGWLVCALRLLSRKTVVEAVPEIEKPKLVLGDASHACTCEVTFTNTKELAMDTVAVVNAPELVGCVLKVTAFCVQGDVTTA